MSDSPRLRIVNTSGAGFKTKIYIDDVDVSECFNNVVVTAGLKDVVTAELTAVACEIEIDGDLHLKLPADGTSELLVRHGWTPPAEPVSVPALVREYREYEKLEDELFTVGEPVGGRELLNRFIERVQRDWEPNDGDELTVKRVYDENGEPIPGKRSYSLVLTMDTDRDNVTTDD